MSIQNIHTVLKIVRIALQVIISLCLQSVESFAITRVSVATGNFNQPSAWNPAGIPGPTDDLTILNGHTITVDVASQSGKLTVGNGGRLNFAPATNLTVNSDFIVYGIADILEANLTLSTPGASFTIGAAGRVTWEPANNTAAGATLFTNGVEFFHPASNLVINRWYNYSSVPLGSVVTGNFGNLTLNTLTNGLLYEWNQDNKFESHKVMGTLTIQQGWVVLDKSGSISNTTIGSIELSNLNSYLDFHSGNHPGSFTINTASITNLSGTLNGIYNGNGNINLHVNGDFTNLGNSILIFNSGVTGVSEGNATMNVTGTFLQSAGDFRGIFNITSPNSGKVNLEFNQVKLMGGIFMGHYACHTSGNISNIKISGDLNIDFSSANSKFRGNGLTSLSGTMNNIGLMMEIEGTLTIKGTTASEFTSSGSTGPETVEIKGEVFFEGCTSNFNYGSHSTTLTLYENTRVDGGVVFLSRTNGSLTAVLHKNLELQYGNLSISGGAGNCNMVVNGDYNQSGGSLFFHNNNSQATGNIIYVTIFGDFLNQSGTITFDNNTGSTAKHHLSLNGVKFSMGGNSVINTSVASTNPGYGMIYFDRMGTMEYYHNSTGIILTNVQQVINDDCVLKVMSGDIQVSESSVSSNDMFLIANGGTLDLGNNHIYGNALNAYSSCMVDDGGRLKISGSYGLYNGTSTAAIKAGGNMTYHLGNKSVVEYYGTAEQFITGTGLGSATSTNQQYGILEINKITGSASLNGNQVTVRSGLVLNEGELNLSGYNVTINTGLPSAITTSGGYIKSEGNSDGTTSMVKWKNISAGAHSIPFGISKNNTIPFQFTPVSGFGNEFAVSTRSCVPDNRPLTAGVSNLDFQGRDAGAERIIDRWFYIAANNITANVTASYFGTENTVLTDLADQNFSFITWYDQKWNLSGGTGNGVETGSGTVIANNLNHWGPMLLISYKALVAADLLDFDAVLNGDLVDISWTSVSNSDADKYTVERSDDEYQFSDLIYEDAEPQSSSPIHYKAVDFAPLQGISWYRLKQHQPDGKLKYSQAVQIEKSDGQSSSLEILSVNPNPFNLGFTAWYRLPVACDVEIKLTGSNGQVVYGNLVSNNTGKNSFEFTEHNNLSPGLYILSISNGKSTKNIKLFHI